MAARGKIPTSSDKRPIQAPGPVASHSGGHRQLGLLNHPELLETKIAAQAAEIKQLMGDNQRLASSHVVLREELRAAWQEEQRLKAHMRSIQTESDIQIRVLADKIARADANIRAGEGARKELQQAIKEAQSYVADRHELTAKIQNVNKELQKARDDIKSLPYLRSELDSLRKEHHRLRSTFEYEKGSNTEQVEELKAMEQKLILMAKEVEKARIDVFDAEKRASAPHPISSAYLNPGFPYPPLMHGKNIAHVDSYITPLVPVSHQMGFWPSVGERTNGYGSSGIVAPAKSLPSSDKAAAAATTSADAATLDPTKATDDAAPASGGASATISGGRPEGEGKSDDADA